MVQRLQLNDFAYIFLVTVLRENRLYFNWIPVDVLQSILWYVYHMKYTVKRALQSQLLSTSAPVVLQVKAWSGCLRGTSLNVWLFLKSKRVLISS